MNTFTELIKIMQSWHSSGKDAALATLVHSSGTTPLPIGEMMAVSSSLDMQGAVSRGCVESAILENAQAVMKKGQPAMVHFGFSEESAFEVGLTCGGEIDVLINPLLRSPEASSFFAAVPACSSSEKSFYLLQSIDADTLGKKVLWNEEKIFFSDLPESHFVSLPLPMNIDDPSKPQAVEIPLADEKKLNAFINIFQPAARMIIVGASEIAIYLTKMAKMLGFQVIVVDPRSMFATSIRFPEADVILSQWPQDCLPALKLHCRDALVVISHDEKIDLPALQIGLENTVSYIGLLGSKKTRLSRFNALKELGYTETDLAPIHAPIGLDIGSKKADEIALSIMSEIILEKNNKRLS